MKSMCRYIRYGVTIQIVISAGFAVAGLVEEGIYTALMAITTILLSMHESGDRS